MAVSKFATMDILDFVTTFDNDETFAGGKPSMRRDDDGNRLLPHGKGWELKMTEVIGAVEKAEILAFWR